MERGKDRSGLRWILTGAVVLLIGAFFGLALSYLRSSPPATEPEQVTKEMPSPPPQLADRLRKPEGLPPGNRGPEAGPAPVPASSPPVPPAPPLSPPPKELQTAPPAAGPGIAPEEGRLQSPVSLPEIGSKETSVTASGSSPQPPPPSPEMGEPKAEETPPPAVVTEKQSEPPVNDRTVSTSAPAQAPPAPEESRQTTAERREPSASGAAQEAAQKEAPAEFAFTIHLGSYKEPENAEKQLALLRSIGLEGFSRTVDLADKGVFQRVFVGRFADRSTAEAMQRRLEEEHDLEGRVVTAQFARGG
jgi:cell division protein FtsN